MAYKSLREFCEILEKKGELIRVSEKADTRLEISEIADRMSKSEGGGKALLFENTGYDFPVLINMLGSHKRMLAALNVESYDLKADEISSLFKKMSGPQKSLKDKLSLLPELSRIASFMPGKQRRKAACKEIISLEPDLNKFPILTTWPNDAAPFITLPQVITKDPDTGTRNVGMYRMQVIDGQTTGMHWHKHKVGARHYNAYKKRGERMPVAVALGGDPLLTFSAVAPLPDNIDEYMLAGFLRKKKVKMVKAETQNIEVPADADIIIEGYIDPEEELFWEGPFGDHTGFYSLADWYPKFHITAISHRKDAIFPATTVGIPPMEDAYISKAIERIFLAPIQLTMLPEMSDMDIPVVGVSHNLTIAAIEKSFSGHAHKVSNALRGAGQMMFNKILVVTDKDAPIHNYKVLARELSQKIDPEQHISFSKGPLDVLDHSSAKFAFGSKMTIDGTTKYEDEIINPFEQTNWKKATESIRENSKKHPEIKQVNTKLLEEGISAIIISAEKTKAFDFRAFADKLSREEGFNAVKLILLIEHPADAEDIELASWLAANNIEPLRDCYVLKKTDRNKTSQIFIDGTRKTKQSDNFTRDWPNVVTMDEATIKKVNEKWNLYDIGPFKASPSLKYMPLKLNDDAVADKNELN